MKLFVIVDYQNDFVNGSLGFPGAELLDEGILRAAQKAYAASTHIAVTYDSHDENYLNTREGKALPVPHCIVVTPGWELYGKTGEWVKTIPHTVLKKKTFGCAPESLLELPSSVTEIELCGLVTNMCVLSNVCCFQARYPKAQISVHAGLCASFDPDLHQKTLDVLKVIQVNIINDSEDN